LQPYRKLLLRRHAKLHLQVRGLLPFLLRPLALL
jgi:hypothetical protein